MNGILFLNCTVRYFLLSIFSRSAQNTMIWYICDPACCVYNLYGYIYLRCSLNGESWNNIYTVWFTLNPNLLTLQHFNFVLDRHDPWVKRSWLVWFKQCGTKTNATIFLLHSTRSLISAIIFSQSFRYLRVTGFCVSEMFDDTVWLSEWWSCLGYQHQLLFDRFYTEDIWACPPCQRGQHGEPVS